MTDISFNRTKGAVVVRMSFDQDVVLVDFVPVRGRWFEQKSVTDGDGNRITGDVKYQYVQLAEEELQAWFITRLQPVASHVKVRSLTERIEIAFFYQLSRLEESEKVRVRPLGMEDISLLQQMGRDIVSTHIEMEADAKESGTPLATDSWYHVKSSVLQRWNKNAVWTAARREFYSSVLGTALAWKQNRVPSDIHKLVERIRFGAELAFSVSK